MPVTKDAAIRYRLIDEMLRKRSFPSLEDMRYQLEDRLGTRISQSTLEKDLRAMRNSNDLGYYAPIKYDKFHRGYYYEDENFSLAKVPLGSEDLLALDFAITLIKQYRDIPLFADSMAAINKVVNAFEVSQALNDFEEESFIQFESAPEQQGIEHLAFLVNAIKNRQPVRLEYQKFGSDDSREHVVHPYLLKEYRNRWYLIGQLEGKEHITILGLDRIVHLEEAHITYRHPIDFEPQQYFQFSFGISTSDHKPEKIRLWFDATQAEYILTQPLHQSQELVERTDDGVIIQLELVPSIELEMNLLSYGERVKVLAPSSLQNRLAERIQAMKGLYE